MKKKKKYMICGGLCLLAVLLFGGCGKKKTEERWDRMYLSAGNVICICDQGMIRKDASSGKIILTEPEGKKKLEVTPPFPAGEYGCYYRENEIYFYCGNEIKRYRLTDKKWEDIGTVDCEGGFFRMLAMTEHWVYIEKYDKDRNFLGIFYMPREAFLDGKSEWKKAVEYGE